MGLVNAAFALRVLAFWSYAAAGQEFSVLRKALRMADGLAAKAETMFGKGDDIVFLALDRLARQQIQ